MSRWILVVTVAIFVSCISGRSGPRRGGGTNTGVGSDEGGPWSGGSPALVEKP
jgi:hypothetical protein